MLETKPEWEMGRATRSIINVPHLIWEFTESNFYTFVVPNTAFGVLGALAGSSRLTDGLPNTPWEVFQRLPIVVFFNWYSVLIFDLANQRSPESVQEDLANKPWRPIPTGKVTPEQTRRAMLVAIPLALAMNYCFGVWKEGVFILILTWLYNDLKGGDELTRDPIISVAFALFNHASLQLAVGSQATINSQGYGWIVLISAMILTTMQVQDLKDQAGDQIRGRRTVPLVFGDSFSRWMIALFTILWSFACAFFWQLPPWTFTPSVTVGSYVAYRAIYQRNMEADARTWKFWCLWTVTLYSLPVLGGFC